MKKIVSIVLIVLLLVGAVYLAAACSSLLKDATLTVKDGAVKVASPVVNAVYKAFVNGKEEDVEADAETGEYEIKIPEESGEKLEVSVEVYDESGKQIGTITKTFDCLPTVVVEAKDGMYDWTASDEEIKKLYPDAQVKYKVWLNDEIFEQAEATCTPDAGISTIRVRAFLVGNSDLYSRYSELKSFTMLAKPSSVRYDGTYLYWAPVDFADMVPTYKVKVAISESESYEATVTNANAMDLAAEFEDVFADEAKKARIYISVQAISSSEKYQTSAASDAELFSYLSGVQNIRFSGSKVVWEANAVADAYRVEVTSNGSIEEYVVEAETFEADEDPYFDVSTVTFAQTTVEVRVRPTVKDAKPINVFAEYSLRVTANFLEVPSELKFEHGFFYWKGVTNAKGYRLTVEKCNSRNEVISTEDVEVGQNVLSVVYPFEEEGLYKVYIATMAGDSPVYVDSIKKGPIEVTRLGSPRTGIKLAESGLNRNFSNTPGAMYTMHLSFNGVGGTGTYYQLLVNGTMIDSGSTAPSFTFEVPANASDKTSDTIDIEVKTLSFNANTLVNGNQVTLNSLTTLKLTCKKLGKPTNLRIEDNLLTWDDNNAESALAAVKAYTVFPSGELQTVYAQNYLDREDTVKNTCSFSLTGYTAGEYPMRVCSRGELTDVEKQNISVSLSQDGKSVVSDHDIILSSDFSDMFYVTKLEAPTNIRMTFDGSSLNWDPCYGAKGYKIHFVYHTGSSTDANNINTFAILNEDGSDVFPVSNTSLLKLLSAQINPNGGYGESESFVLSEVGCTFSIIAIGDSEPTIGKNYGTVSSDYSSTQPLYRVAAPTNLQVKGTLLQWTLPDDISKISRYAIYDGGELIGYQENGKNTFDISNATVGEHYYYICSEGDEQVSFASDFTYLKDGIKVTIAGQEWTGIVKLQTIDSTWAFKGTKYAWSEIKYDNNSRKIHVAASSYDITLFLGTANYTKTDNYTPDKNGVIENEERWFYYEPDFRKEATPIFQVVCRGDNVTTMDSDTFRYYQKTKTLAEPIPAKQGEKLVEYVMVDGKIGVKVNATSAGYGFLLKAQGIEWVIDVNKEGAPAEAVKILENVQRNTTYTLTVADKGDRFDKNGVYVYTSSAINADSITYLGQVEGGRSITLLQGIKKNGVYEHTLRWNSLTGAKYKAYYCIYDVNNETEEETLLYTSDAVEDNEGNTLIDAQSATITIDWDAYEAAEGHETCVRCYVLAVGNDNTVFSSTQYAVSNLKVHF